MHIDMKTKALSNLLKQTKHNPWYGRFAAELGFDAYSAQLTDWWNWPFIPINIFKEVDGFRCIDQKNTDMIFYSSGTSATSNRAKHYVRDITLYEKASLSHFSSLYPLEEFTILAYLPAYSDNPNSSLLKMVEFIVRADQSHLSRFLDINNPQIDDSLIQQINTQSKKILLFGAAFGLVDWVERSAPRLPEGSIIMETGGMKTFRKEMTRSQIKKVLSEGFGISEDSIHSEFGMCELLSQAYEHGDGWYRAGPDMFVFAKKEGQPFSVPVYGEEAQLYVIDLINEHSCSFIQLQDRGIVLKDGRFQVLGRLNASDMRGCNFLMEQD